MKGAAAVLVRAALKTLGVGRRPSPRQCCRRYDVLTESDIRMAALHLSRSSGQDWAAVQSLLRELVQLNTPALYLNVVQEPRPGHVALRPWAGRTIRFRGRHYLLDAGTGAAEGIEAFTDPPGARITSLYPTAPDHPVHAISIEHQDERVIAGSVPAWATHVTIVVNGRVITRCERLLRERGPQIWAA